MSIFIGGFTGIITEPQTGVTTANNGLTVVADNVELGGTLIKNTSINLATLFLRLRDGDFTLESCDLNALDTNILLSNPSSIVFPSTFALNNIDSQGSTTIVQNCNLILSDKRGFIYRIAAEKV